MKLDKMFDIQKSFQDRLKTFDKIEDDGDKQEFINQNILALVEESVEIMRCTPYKNPNYVKFGWKKNQEWDINLYKDEIVDLFHFLMNLCLVVGMNSTEFFEIYCKKNKVNFKRQDDGY